jgi:hypothetical protein
MPETTDLPVDLPAPFVTFGPAGAVVIGGLATYGAVRLSIDTTRSIKAMLKARKARKAAEAQQTPVS